MTFTKNELVDAIEKYWARIKNNPDAYDAIPDVTDTSLHDSAIDTVDELIDIILSQLYYYLVLNFSLLAAIHHNPLQQNVAPFIII